MDRQLIEEFVACGTRLRRAVAGLSPEDLTARPGPGDWSIFELVIHLTDSDSIAIDRMKRMLTEDEPQLLNADETAYVRILVPHEQSLEDSLTLFELGRKQFARVLRALPDEAFERRGVHNRRGVLTVGYTVKRYNDHFNHHLEFLAGKRARLGKPLSSIDGDQK
jgi:DinB superfamily